MAKKSAKRKQGKGDAASEIYKLKTQAVDDLVHADAENSPPVSRAELERYGGRKKGGIPNWLKVCFVKFWFPGSVYFFIVMGLGLWDPLDQIVILGIVMGMVTDLLTNNVLRFMAETDGGNNGWIMFAKKRYLTFFFNIFYAMLLCLMVLLVYAGVDWIVNLLHGTRGEEYLMGEPIGYGLFYMLCDLALVGLKNLCVKLIHTAKNKTV